MDDQPVIYDRAIEILLIFLVVFTPLAYGAVEPSAIAAVEITAALMAFIWSLKILKDRRPEFVSNPLNPFIFLFIFYICLQLFFSHCCLPLAGYKLPRSIYPWATKSELLKAISYALIFLVTLNTIRTQRQIMRILSFIIAIGFIMGVFHLSRYLEVRAPRGFINKDHFSAYLGMIVPLALGLLFMDQLSRQQTLKLEQRILLFFTVIIMGSALFFTMSRGGMFSFIASVLFMAILVLTRKSTISKGWVLSVVAIFIIAAIAWLGATPVIERLLSVKAEITSLYFGGRLPIWQGTLNIIKDYLAFGTGLGTFNHVFPGYQPAQIMAKHYSYAHSDFLELLSEIGIAGFLLMACGLLCLAAHVFKYLNRLSAGPWVTGICVGFLGSLTSIFINSFADFNLHIPANAVLLALILALTLAALNMEHPTGPHSCFRKKAWGPSSDIPRLVLRSPKGEGGSGSFFAFIHVHARGLLRRGIKKNGFAAPQKSPKGIFRLSLFALALIAIGLYVFNALRPALADYYFQKAAGSISRAQGYPSKAQTELVEKAIRIEPANAAYHYLLGKLYFEQACGSALQSAGKKQLDNAISEYRAAVELNPVNGKYHQSLAWAYGVLVDLDKSNKASPQEAARLAHRHFQQAIQLDPHNAYRHRVYAIWLFNHPTEENIVRGINEYRAAIGLNPELTKDLLERYAQYRENYEKIADIFPGTQENDYHILIFLIKEKGLKFAVDFAEKFLKTYPYNAEMHFWIADRSFYDKAFPWEFTERHYNIAFKNEPGNACYRMWHGMHLCMRHKYQEALKELEKSMEMGLSPDNEKEVKEYIAECERKLRGSDF